MPRFEAHEKHARLEFDGCHPSIHTHSMDQPLTFTVLQLQESAARLPDLASTAEAMVEVAVDDGIFRHSEHYPHYDTDREPIVPPRPVLTFRKSSSNGQWELSGSMKLMPYELTEAAQAGLEAWLRWKLGPRCAGVEAGAPEGAVVPVRILFEGSREHAASPDVVSGTYANNPDEARQNDYRAQGAVPVKSTA